MRGAFTRLYTQWVDISSVARFLDCSLDVPYAEVTLIPGCLLALPAERTARRFRAGETSLVLTTGCWRDELGMSEGEAHARVLHAAGVPPSAVLTDHAACNTQENVAFALELARARLGRAPGEVRVVAKWYHSRRCLMHVAALLPPGTPLYADTYEIPGVPRGGWSDVPGAEAHLLKEWARLRDWGRPPDMRPVERVGNAWFAVPDGP